MDQIYCRVPLYTEDGEELYRLYMSTGNCVKHHPTTVVFTSITPTIPNRTTIPLRLSLKPEISHHIPPPETLNRTTRIIRCRRQRQVWVSDGLHHHNAVVDLGFRWATDYLLKATAEPDVIYVQVNI
ncbi:hypothetical protein LXL04_028702 [Taraxacum kok-saghyz]